MSIFDIFTQIRHMRSCSSVEGRDTKATLGEQAAEGGDQGALAGVGGGAEDYEKPGHGWGEGAQVYLPFGRWGFAKG
jgi:hypothetical protein